MPVSVRKRDIRPRPVDIFRNLTVVRSDKDIAEDDEPTKLVIERIKSLDPEILPALVCFHNGFWGDRPNPPKVGINLTNFFQQIRQQKSKQEIPTPVVNIVSDYGKEFRSSFKIPSFYIRSNEAVREDELAEVDYMLDEIDRVLDWI